MRQLKLGIVGMESNYVIGLMNYINADKRNPFFAMAFSTEERLENYLKEHTLDALLYEESMMPVIVGLPEGKNICTIKLAEQAPDKTEKEAIYRYLSVEEILKRVLRIIKAEEAEGKWELFATYAVISPIGRSGKTGKKHLPDGRGTWWAVYRDGSIWRKEAGNFGDSNG